MRKKKKKGTESIVSRNKKVTLPINHKQERKQERKPNNRQETPAPNRFSSRIQANDEHVELVSLLPLFPEPAQQREHGVVVAVVWNKKK